MEDPFIWRDEDGCHLIAKDMHENVCGERFGGICAHSGDGIRWELTDKLSYSRRVRFEDGSERLMGNLKRPFILSEGGKPICAFFAVSDGTPQEGFMRCTKTWNMAVPLKEQR